MTILLNFAHPFVSSQISAIEGQLKEPLNDVREIAVQFDHVVPFAEQASTLVDGIGLTPAEWQTLPIIINPPAHALIAVTLLAELHGRMGYFPPVVRLKPTPGRVPVTFELAEIIALQDVRETARLRRR